MNNLYWCSLVSVQLQCLITTYCHLQCFALIWQFGSLIHTQSMHNMYMKHIKLTEWKWYLHLKIEITFNSTKVNYRIRLPYNVQVFGDIYSTKYMGKSTDTYIWDVEILAAKKFNILSQNLCCKYRKQHRIVDASFRFLGEFYIEKYSKVFLWNA